jgi:hypothetical protein
MRGQARAVVGAQHGQANAVLPARVLPSSKPLSWTKVTLTKVRDFGVRSALTVGDDPSETRRECAWTLYLYPPSGGGGFGNRSLARGSVPIDVVLGRLRERW